MTFKDSLWKGYFEVDEHLFSSFTEKVKVIWQIKQSSRSVHTYEGV